VGKRPTSPIFADFVAIWGMSEKNSRFPRAQLAQNVRFTYTEFPGLFGC